MWWAIAGVLALGAGLAGPVMSNVEQPPYRVIEQQGDIAVSYTHLTLPTIYSV